MKSIIVDNRISEKEEYSLLKLGFNVLKAPSCHGLPTANASHPDTLFCKLGNNLFTYADYAEEAMPLLSDIREYHRNVKISFVSDIPSPIYPGDCQLNALYVGGKLYARRQSLSSSVGSFAESGGIELVGVKQGYPACSVMKIDENGAVTSDRGMADSLVKNGIDVLLISEGNISLPPHKYGFIGGASFVFSDTAYFFGDITTHPDAEKIISFIKSLTNSFLYDMQNSGILIIT